VRSDVGCNGRCLEAKWLDGRYCAIAELLCVWHHVAWFSVTEKECRMNWQEDDMREAAYIRRNGGIGLKNVLFLLIDAQGIIGG